MTSPIRLVMSADRNYAIPMQIALTSVRHNLPHQHAMDVTVLSLDLSAEDIQWRNRGRDDVLRLCRPALPPDIRLPISGHVSSATYFRLCAELAVPPDTDRVIYMDCDLVVTQDLSHLWNTALQGQVVGAVADYSLWSWNNPAHDGIRNLLPANPQLPYFNGGVLLLDMHEWRRRDVMRKAFEFLHAHPGAAQFWDQDAMNVVLCDKWHALDSRWNRPSNFRRAIETGGLPFPSEQQRHLNNAYILHFVSGSKPWTDYRHPDKRIFDRYASLAGFPSFRFTLPKAVMKRATRWLKVYKGAAP